MQQGTRRHRLLVGLSVALILVVALSGPNAAKPDLRSGWPLDGLLPFTLSSALVTGLLWVAYAVAAVAIALALWRPVPALGRRTPWVLGGLGLLAVLAAPIGSADHVNYAAYGRILWLGGDPWTASPADFAGGSDPITSAVEEPWRTEPSVYGPLATLIQAGAAAIGGTHLRLVVLAWQVVVVAAWLLVRWCLRRLVDEENAGRVDVLWTLNPLVFAVGVLGAHVDVLATALSSLLVRAHGPKLAAIIVALIGVGTVLVDGAPFWGADGGGPPAAIPGFAYLVLSILGIAMTWRRGLILALSCAALFLGIAFLDWLRPATERTHLGRFIQSIIDGGALDIVIRKGKQNLDILLGNAPLTLLVPAALLFVIYVLARPTSWGSRALQRSFQTLPTLRAGLVALVITLTIGFLINDSGTAIPAVGATVAVPLIVAVAVSALADEARVGAPTRRDRRRR